MEYQHAHGGDPAVRFSVIRALVTASQSDQSYRSTAHVMVVLALWPGLDAVLWRLARGFPAARHDLPADILARVSEAILALDLTRVTAVVSTILRNVERDIRRDLIRQRVRGQISQSMDDPAFGHMAVTMIATDPKDDQTMADHLKALKPDDASLLRRIFILGETQEEAGRSLGLTPCAARKRFQRSLHKIEKRRESSPVLSHSNAPVGL